MTISTITAEGGTIQLNTASDGSVSASSADFAVTVVQQTGGGGGGGVVAYASVAALIAASTVSLAPGYYEVVGEWITYWDGMVFSPPAPQVIVEMPAVPEYEPRNVAIPYPPQSYYPLIHDDASYASDLDTGASWTVL